MKFSSLFGLFCVSSASTCTALQADSSRESRTLQFKDEDLVVIRESEYMKILLPVELEYWLQVDASITDPLDELLVELDAQMVFDIEQAFAEDDLTMAHITVDSIETDVLRK